MKTLILLLSMYQPINVKAWSLSYTIKEVKPNAKLAKNVAQIRFEFSTPDNCGKDKITVSFNKNKPVIPLLVKNQYVLTYPKGKYKLTLICPGCDTIVTDTIQLKSQTTTTLTANFGKSTPVKPCIVNVTFKPVIYLYPKDTTIFNLSLNYKGDLKMTYPPMQNNNWNVKASPNGNLWCGQKLVRYLFWDGVMDNSQINYNQSEGFILSSSQLISFFEEKLTQAGLNSMEIADFITFWIPMMQENDTVYIHFLFTEDYDQVATLNITPKPDSMLRLFMLWSPVNDQLEHTITPQRIPRFNRSNNALIEWGGSEINPSF